MLTGTYKYKDIIVTIDYDDPGESPREWSDLATMVCSHRRYNLGDEQAENIDLYSSWQEWRENELPEGAVSLPLYLYDHSGITISTTPFSCRWDSGQVGYIYMTEQEMQEQGCTKEQAIEYMRAEVNIYDKYLRGEVYSITMERAEYESVGGFYFDQSKDIIDALHEYFVLSDNELKALTAAITG